MKTYQKHLYEVFKPYRVPPTYPTYPPQHEGPYMEEYFCDNFEKEPGSFKRYFIPIYWTSCYKHNNTAGLQEALDSLDPSKKYVAVCTHDDAPMERLPDQTVVFSAACVKGDIPIPVSCSGFKNIKTNPTRDIFASFIGSHTHPIREVMCRQLMNDEKYALSLEPWQEKIPEAKESFYRQIMERSKFTLCPRGYGLTSYRLYEAMQLGSVPVFIYDVPWIPWELDLDWDEFCVLLKPNEIPHLDTILTSYSDDEIVAMSQRAQEVYESHFCMNAIYRIITNKLKTPGGEK